VLADRALRANQQNEVDSASTADSVKAGLGNTRAKTNLQRKVDPAVMDDSVKGQNRYFIITRFSNAMPNHAISTR
jgi:hypothetical protein